MPRPRKVGSLPRADRSALGAGLVAPALVLGLVAGPAAAASARFDLDVSPEEASVYLDGDRRGQADDFDDSPDYLWVSPGPHVLELKHRGYQTLRILFEARSGEERRFGYDLVRGSSSDVREIDLRPQGGAPGQPAPPPMPPADPAAANVRFLVEPADAAVWIDGIFLGPAGAYDGSRQIARLPPGRHTVELTRPGFRTQTLAIDMRAGQERTVRLALEPQPE